MGSCISKIPDLDVDVAVDGNKCPSRCCDDDKCISSCCFINYITKQKSTTNI